MYTKEKYIRCYYSPKSPKKVQNRHYFHNGNITSDCSSRECSQVPCHYLGLSSAFIYKMLLCLQEQITTVNLNIRPLAGWQLLTVIEIMKNIIYRMTENIVRLGNFMILNDPFESRNERYVWYQGFDHFKSNLRFNIPRP